MKRGSNPGPLAQQSKVSPLGHRIPFLKPDFWTKHVVVLSVIGGICGRVPVHRIPPKMSARPKTECQRDLISCHVAPEKCQTDTGATQMLDGAPLQTETRQHQVVFVSTSRNYFRHSTRKYFQLAKTCFPNSFGENIFCEVSENLQQKRMVGPSSICTVSMWAFFEHCLKFYLGRTK